MHYKIEIPKPSAKRLEKDRRVVIEAHLQPYGMNKTELLIPDEDANVVEFDFEFDEQALHDENVLDGGVWYKCYFEYRNSTGSRVEKIAFDWKELEEDQG